MFGDKRLEMPKDVDSCRIIMHNFGLVWPDSTNDLMHNVKRLVELNNEVYDNKPRYKVIYDISRDGLIDGKIIANVGDILTAGWYEDKHCGRWALLKDGEYVCDVGSRCETHCCTPIKPA